MLTAAQVAQVLGISERAVRALPIARYHFGRALRFDEADVQAYKESLTPPKPLLTMRVLREYERLRLRALAIDGEAAIPPLPPHLQALTDKRYRRQRQAPWADGKAIRAIYAEARRLTRETGIAHHVDHEIPLMGEFVSGLHVETNLQILTGSENTRKHNHFEIE